MQELEKIILELTKLFEESIPLEKEKLKAAANKQVTFVEDCMKKEQALLLKIRGLDQKRVNILKKLGYENKTFKEIIQEQPRQIQDKLIVLFENFSKAISEFSSINDEALKLISLNLHEIDVVVSQRNTQVSSQNHITDKRV